MRFTAPVLLLLVLLAGSAAAAAQGAGPGIGWTGRWLERVAAAQAAQPHWMTPLVTVTPRLEQEFRADVTHEATPSGYVTNVDNGKGLEVIPSRHTEMLINLPPYLFHQNPGAMNGPGDASFMMKYRLLARNEEHGNGILTGFLAGSVPTGTYTNGSVSAIVTPTLAAGKGWGNFDVQSTLGGALPVDSEHTLGRTILSNTALQYHPLAWLWPEAEINSAIWEGGTNDGKKQTFVMPGLIFGRFSIHHRIALVAGAGFQMAVTHYHQYNHAFIATVRMPF